MHHKAIGTTVLALGVVIALFGLALMAILGPDGRFTSGPHSVDADGVAVVTAPTVINWKNVEIEILAEVPANKPVFVGVGNSVDVQAYLKGVRRLEVTSFETPWKVRTRQAAGRDALPGAPTALDWWRANAAGLGGAAIKTRLPDETVSAAVLAVGSSNLRGLKVTIAYGLKGAFLKGLGLLLLGGGLGWAGLLTRRGERLWEVEGEPEDESPLPGEPSETDHEIHEVYVYVDEDGVEHEISAEEAARYEVVEHVEHVEHAEPEPQPEPEPEPEPQPEPEPEPEPQPEPEPEPEPRPEPEPEDDEPPRYFWVDENGVEHEVTADELHEFELYDEDES